VPISISESLVVALPPILSPSSRTFIELALINWRRPWGSRRLDFVIRAGSFKFFIDKISKFFGCRQQQTVRSHLAESIFIYSGQIAMEMAYPHQARSNFSIDNIIRRLFSLRRGQGVRLPEDSGCLQYSLVHRVLEKFESD
jgi:hypothetical protein